MQLRGIQRGILSIHALLQCASCTTITVREHIVGCAASAVNTPASSAAASSFSIDSGAARDARFNAGVPFVILLQQLDMTGWGRRQAVTEYSWLMPNGNTTVNCTRAGSYTIRDGELHIGNKTFSTDNGKPNMAFVAHALIGNITRSFSVDNGFLNWTNSHFTDSVTQFYKLPPGLLENALILAKFVGPKQRERGWSPIVLHAVAGRSSFGIASLPCSGEFCIRKKLTGGCMKVPADRTMAFPHRLRKDPTKEGQVQLSLQPQIQCQQMEPAASDPKEPV